MPARAVMLPKAVTSPQSRKELVMIYTIERRSARCDGSVVSWYEVRSYTHITPIGVYANGKTLIKVMTKREAKKYCMANGIDIA